MGERENAGKMGIIVQIPVGCCQRLGRTDDSVVQSVRSANAERLAVTPALRS